jgi:hypothetical protein
MEEKISLSVEELDFLNKGLKCIEYMFDSFINGDYESAKIETQEFLHVLDRLQQIEEKKARRAQLEAIVKEMRDRGIRIDFASRVASF